MNWPNCKLKTVNCKLKTKGGPPAFRKTALFIELHSSRSKPAFRQPARKRLCIA
jgi:hypothetical protein